MKKLILLLLAALFAFMFSAQKAFAVFFEVKKNFTGMNRIKSEKNAVYKISNTPKMSHAYG